MEEWEKLKSVDVRKVNPNELTDIMSILEDENNFENKEIRMKNFIDNVKNPYCFMVGDIIVKSIFTEGYSLKQRLQELVDGISN